jgi:hypothetical protein
MELAQAGKGLHGTAQNLNLKKWQKVRKHAELEMEIF